MTVLYLESVLVEESVQFVSGLVNFLHRHWSSDSRDAGE